MCTLHNYSTESQALLLIASFKQTVCLLSSILASVFKTHLKAAINKNKYTKQIKVQTSHLSESACILFLFFYFFLFAFVTVQHKETEDTAFTHTFIQVGEEK